jgi:hypothetical protein
MSLPSFTSELMDKLRPILRPGLTLPLRQKTIGATAIKAICHRDEVLVMRPFGLGSKASYKPQYWPSPNLLAQDNMARCSAPSQPGAQYQPADGAALRRTGN